jgi:hypothetical protein
MHFDNSFVNHTHIWRPKKNALQFWADLSYMVLYISKSNFHYNKFLTIYQRHYSTVLRVSILKGFYLDYYKRIWVISNTEKVPSNVHVSICSFVWMHLNLSPQEHYFWLLLHEFPISSIKLMHSLIFGYECTWLVWRSKYYM